MQKPDSQILMACLSQEQIQTSLRFGVEPQRLHLGKKSKLWVWFDSFLYQTCLERFVATLGQLKFWGTVNCHLFLYKTLDGFSQVIRSIFTQFLVIHHQTKQGQSQKSIPLSTRNIHGLNSSARRFRDS